MNRVKESGGQSFFINSDGVILGVIDIELKLIIITWDCLKKHLVYIEETVCSTLLPDSNSSEANKLEGYKIVIK